MPINAVIESPRGLIVAPAGCGKTQLIIDALRYPVTKPRLVLTHTTAGVAALKQRLRKLQIPVSNYRVSTIAGWALNISAMFPKSCGYLNNKSTPPNYMDLQQKVTALIQQGHVADILQSSYSKVFVDEYQDCSDSQHKLICELSNILSTVIFGDPLQAIFGFSKGDPLPNWKAQVETAFPIISTLNTPWRWINVGNQILGEWILEVRRAFLSGEKIDLNTRPNCVIHHQLTTDTLSNKRSQISVQYQIRQSIPHHESLLIIGDSVKVTMRHDFAKSTQGIDVVEPVDLKDIIDLAGVFDNLQAYELLEQILSTASNFMTGIDKAGTLKRIEIIKSGKNRTAPTNVELQAIRLENQKSPQEILNLISELESSGDTKVYRSAALAALKDTLLLSISQPDKTIKEAAVAIRERRRQHGDNRITNRSIGSTLLLKGLEAEHVLILDASQMDMRNLYVALSRGSKTITLFS